uniref:Putative secreted protein n=1 Tax=Anopheles darlingi TaxID=43151 RepID=A0A2M4D846_ANODA
MFAALALIASPVKLKPHLLTVAELSSFVTIVDCFLFFQFRVDLFLCPVEGGVGTTKSIIQESSSIGFSETSFFVDA